MVTAVVRENFGLRQIGRRPVLVRIAKDELARLQWCAGTWRRLFARAVDDRLRQPIAVTKVVVRVVEWWSRLDVQRRKRLHAFATGDELVVLRLTARALAGVAGEQDSDRVGVGARQAAHPVLRMIRPRVAQHLGARGHALLELIGKSGERTLVLNVFPHYQRNGISSVFEQPPHVGLALQPSHKYVSLFDFSYRLRQVKPRALAGDFHALGSLRNFQARFTLFLLDHEFGRLPFPFKMANHHLKVAAYPLGRPRQLCQNPALSRA
jgi:hypothetical protein